MLTDQLKACWKEVKTCRTQNLSRFTLKQITILKTLIPSWLSRNTMLRVKSCALHKFIVTQTQQSAARDIPPGLGTNITVHGQVFHNLAIYKMWYNKSVKRIIYASLWCTISTIFLLTAGALLGQRYAARHWFWQRSAAVLGENTTASTDETLTNIEEASPVGGATTADARAQLVANFIERNDAGHNSPLQPYDYWGRYFVEIADEYGLDFRLLPAIARKESTFCKSNSAKTYYNCFGYGVPSSGITDAGKFTSYQEGIRTVAAALKKNYLDQGLTDPVAIMRKYCPPSAEGSGAWSTNINQWLAEMRYDDKTSGLKNQENTDLTEFIGAPATNSTKVR